MKKFLKKTSLFLVTAAMTVSAPLMAWALEHDIVILHTNDIHCGINDNIGFAGLAQIKKDALARTPNVALVDAGDAIQGAPIGKLSRGMAVVDIMNYLGYDFCIPGNHEFDYGMDRFMELLCASSLSDRKRVKYGRDLSRQSLAAFCISLTSSRSAISVQIVENILARNAADFVYEFA